MAPTFIDHDIEIDRVFSYNYSSFFSHVANSVDFSSLYRSPEGREPIRRQTEDSSTVIIPTTYHGINDGPSPGVIVGIVLGSISGLLVLFSIFYVCCLRRDFGEFRNSSPALTSRRSRRRRRRRSSRSRSNARRNRGTSSRYTRSIVENKRSYRQPRVKVRRPLFTVPSVSASRSISSPARYPSRARDDSSARHPNSEKRSYQRDSIPRDSDEIVVIEEPIQSRRSTGGARSMSSRGSRRSHERARGHSMSRNSSRRVQSSIGRAS